MRIAEGQRRLRAPLVFCFSGLLRASKKILSLVLVLGMVLVSPGLSPYQALAQRTVQADPVSVPVSAEGAAPQAIFVPGPDSFGGEPVVSIGEGFPDVSGEIPLKVLSPDPFPWARSLTEITLSRDPHPTLSLKGEGRVRVLESGGMRVAPGASLVQRLAEFSGEAARFLRPSVSGEERASSNDSAFSRLLLESLAPVASPSWSGFSETAPQGPFQETVSSRQDRSPFSLREVLGTGEFTAYGNDSAVVLVSAQFPHLALKVFTDPNQYEGYEKAKPLLGGLAAPYTILENLELTVSGRRVQVAKAIVQERVAPLKDVLRPGAAPSQIRFYEAQLGRLSQAIWRKGFVDADAANLVHNYGLDWKNDLVAYNLSGLRGDLKFLDKPEPEARSAGSPTQSVFNPDRIRADFGNQSGEGEPVPEPQPASFVNVYSKTASGLSPPSRRPVRSYKPPRGLRIKLGLSQGALVASFALAMAGWTWGVVDLAGRHLWIGAGAAALAFLIAYRLFSLVPHHLISAEEFPQFQGSVALIARIMKGMGLRPDQAPRLYAARPPLDGGHPFVSGQMDADWLKARLRRSGSANEIVLQALGFSRDHLSGLTPDSAAAAFNRLLSLPDLHANILSQDPSPLEGESMGEGWELYLDLGTRILLKAARDMAVSGQALASPYLERLNRGLLEALYPRETHRGGVNMAPQNAASVGNGLTPSSYIVVDTAFPFQGVRQMAAKLAHEMIHLHFGDPAWENFHDHVLKPYGWLMALTPALLLATQWVPHISWWQALVVVGGVGAALHSVMKDVARRYGFFLPVVGWAMAWGLMWVPHFPLRIIGELLIPLPFLFLSFRSSYAVSRLSEFRADHGGALYSSAEAMIEALQSLPEPSSPKYPATIERLRRIEKMKEQQQKAAPSAP